jgi:uncharacterized RDD family membrane protein YckC
MEFLPIEIGGKKVYAGFWKRFGAAIVDLLVFIPLLIVFHFLQGISIPVAMVVVVFSTTSFWIYLIYFHYKFGATLGKMATGVKLSCPNGSNIQLKHAVLRSSVDLGFSFFVLIAQVIAISNAQPETYLSSGYVERANLIVPLFPSWHQPIDILGQIWFWSELIVLLFNKRKRAIHDFIAGTIVIHKEFAEQVREADGVEVRR